MKKYLLLRSNKQSGPYSADELRQMGLKPYDLIWVDGKSAAWRYPGEVDELKSFAPPVEEQPYDRFYKKPEEAKAQEAAPATSVSAPKVEEPAEKQPQKKEKEYKRIFVTLPTGAAPAKPVVQPPKQVFGESLQQENTYRQPASEIPTPEPAKTRVPAEQPAPATEAISYPQRRRSSNRKPLALAAACLAMAGMVALGIFIGMSLNKKEGVSLVKQIDKVDAPTQPAASKSAANLHPEPLVGEVDNPLPNENPATSTAQVPPVVKKKSPPSIDSANQATVIIPVKNDTENIAEKKEEPVKKPLPKPVAPNFEKLIAVSNNDYQVGPFGGISKLELTLKNSSDYDLNLVVVQVDYLKVNKEVFKTENLYFRDVAANSTVTLEAPRSSRGNKVNYKVTLVNSKDHLYHAGN